MPARDFESRREHYIAPPPDGRSIELAVDPASERLQLIKPWAAWDGRDFLDMPVLIKTRGKTTTDHISPTGKWLRYRGHLERFSDNLLWAPPMRRPARSGRRINVVSGASGQPIAAVARDYRARGMRWVIVGDANYGEGSSREHAALVSPPPRRRRGHRAQLRPHPRIEPQEAGAARPDLHPYGGLRAHPRGRSAEPPRDCGSSPRASRYDAAWYTPDGTEEILDLQHSYSERQLAWFRAGSALNTLAPLAGAEHGRERAPAAGAAAQAR